MTKFESRKKKVMDHLQIKKNMGVEEVSELIGISPATTRRFFSQLANEGTVVRTHGGVQIIPESTGTYSYILANTRRVQTKARIAAKGVELINSGDLLFLDSGTTILKLAEVLELKLKAGELDELVIVTNSLLNYEKLSEFSKVILIGGEVRLSRRDTCGQLAENALKSLHVHKSFFGADAIHPEKGLMTTDEWTSRMNDIIGKNSEKIYVLADSEKFGKSSLMTYSELDAVNLIITDDGISEDDLAVYREKGAIIEVVPRE